MNGILTNRQTKILDFIKGFIEQNGHSPTLREIGNAFGIASTFGVKRHVDALLKKGFINYRSNSSRTITIVGRAPIDPESNEARLMDCIGFVEFIEEDLGDQRPNSLFVLSQLKNKIDLVMSSLESFL